MLSVEPASTTLQRQNAFPLFGKKPHLVIFHTAGDISHACQYDWYEWCYFREQGAAFPHNQEVLGRVLGPARGEGNEMAQWILQANGRQILRRLLHPLTVAERPSASEKTKRKVFDALFERR